MRGKKRVIRGCHVPVKALILQSLQLCSMSVCPIESKLVFDGISGQTAPYNINNIVRSINAKQRALQSKKLCGTDDQAGFAPMIYSTERHLTELPAVCVNELASEY